MTPLRLMLAIALVTLQARSDCGSDQQRGEKFELELVTVVVDGTPEGDLSAYADTTVILMNEVNSVELDGRTRSLILSANRSSRVSAERYQNQSYGERYPASE